MCILFVSFLIADLSVDTDFSGTTLVSACIRGTRLVITNVGDSRIVLGKRKVGDEKLGFEGGREASWGKFVAQPLTEDHKPDNPEEVKLLA